MLKGRRHLTNTNVLTKVDLVKYTTWKNRWRNSNVLVYHGPLLTHLLGVAPSTFITGYMSSGKITILHPPEVKELPILTTYRDEVM